MTLTATWTKLSPSVPLDRSSLALSVIGDKAYIFGGERVPRQPIDADLHAINLSDGFVETLKAPADSDQWPSARVGSATAAVGSDLYIWGGREGKAMSPSSGELYKFDTANSTFSVVPVLASLDGEQPEDRSFHVLTAHGSTLLLHGGCPASGRLATLHSLDLSTSSPAWKLLSPAPGPGRGGSNLQLVQTSPRPAFARFGGFAGFETDDLVFFHPETGKWSTPTLKEGSPTPQARSVTGFVGLPWPSPLSDGGAILAYLFLGERDPTAPEVGHEGAGAFHKDSWAFCSTGKEGVFEWRKAEPAEGADRPEGLGWFGSDWWEGGNAAVMYGGLESGNERRGDVWTLKIEEQ